MGFLAPIVGIAAKKIIATLILGGASVFYQKRQQKKLQRQAEQAKRDMEGFRLSFGDPAQARTFAFATDIRSSGPVIYAYVLGPYLVMIIPVSTQQMSWTSTKTMWVDGEQVTLDRDQGNGWWSPSSGKYATASSATFNVCVRLNYNAWDSQVGSGLIGGVLNLPGLATQWDDTHTCTGFSYMSVYVGYNQNLFQGLPDLSFNLIPSASTSTQTYMGSDLGNPATALYEYMTQFFGESAANIDLTSFLAAKSRCDETVSGKKRYQISQTFQTDQTPQEIIDTILDSMNGDLIKAGATWYLKNNYATPTITFDEDDIVGPINVETRRSYADAFNRVIGLYKSEVQSDQPQTYPPVVDSTAVSQDGETITYTFDLPQVPEPEQAQRVALIELKKNRLEISLSLKVNARGLLVKAGDTINLTIARYGWTSKPFVITSHKIIVADEVSCAMNLQETSSAVYDDYSGSSIGSVAQTNLPRANDVPAPTNLVLDEKLYLFADVVGSRVIMSWTYDSYAFINQFEVEYKPSASSEWISIGAAEGTKRSIDLDVEEPTDYDFRVRAVNTLLYRSEWLTEEEFEVVGKTAAPANVGTISQEQSNSGFLIRWAKVADLDVKEYLVRYGTTSQVWADVANTEVRTGTSLIVPFFAAGTRRYFVKAVDTSGNESETAATADITIYAPASVYPTIAVVDQQLVISWSEVAAGSGYLNVLNYEVRHGASWAAGTLVGLAKTTRLIAPIFPAGTRTYWLAAIDVFGNVGTPQSQPVTLAAPGDVTSTSVVKSDAGIVVSWAAPSVGSYQFPIANYDIRYGASWAAGTPLGIAKTTTITTPFFAAGTRQFWIAAIDVAGNVGSAVGSEFVINVPGQPESLTAVKSDAGVVISWGAAAVGTNQLNIVEYEVRYGTSFDAGTLVGIAKTTTITSAFFSAAERFYFIKARDVVGNVTATAASVSFTIENPDAISSATITINDEDALLSFDFPAIGSDQLQIREFEIRVGPTYATSSLVALTLSTQIKIPFFKITSIPSQARTYWITPVDIVGNAATPFSVDFTITQPSAPLNLVAQAVRNVVFLNWTQPDSTVPIRYYRVSKQDSPADQIYGDFDSTAYRIEEPVGGTFTYKVQAIDFVGNISDVSSQSIVVDDPDGFEIVTTFSDPNYNTVGSITGDDFVDDGGIAIILGMNSTDTFTEHFTDNSWSTPQDQIDAGYPIFAQPVESGNWTYSGEFDIGAVVAAGTIILTAAKQILNGLDFAQFEPEISVKENSGDSWIEFDNVWSVSTVDFRYIRIRIFIEIDSDQQVVNLAGAGVTVVVQVAKKTESGVASAVSSDVGGTSVSLVRTFVDISEVICTVNGSSAYFATATWTDPNPTEIQIFAFDTSNSRVNASVSYTVRGV